MSMPDMSLDQSVNKRKRNLDRLAWFLDNSIKVPFLSKRIGVDSLIGLLPGFGDAIGGLLSTWILVQGVRLNVSRTTFFHMVFNVAIEVVIGFIPFFGDLFDMGWKANHRNVKLLSHYLDQPSESSRGSMFWLGTILLVLTAIGVGTIWIGLRVLAWVWSWISPVLGG